MPIDNPEQPKMVRRSFFIGAACSLGAGAIGSASARCSLDDDVEDFAVRLHSELGGDWDSHICQASGLVVFSRRIPARLSSKSA